MVPAAFSWAQVSTAFVCAGVSLQLEVKGRQGRITSSGGDRAGHSCGEGGTAVAVQEVCLPLLQRGGCMKPVGARYGGTQARCACAAGSASGRCGRLDGALPAGC